jgi:hypothetical protein
LNQVKGIKAYNVDDLTAVVAANQVCPSTLKL